MEVIRYPDAFQLTVNHWTAPWVVMALLECGVSPSEERITSAIEQIAQSSENGLWNWEAIKRPV